jgi:hypothetical protein
MYTKEQHNQFRQEIAKIIKRSRYRTSATVSQSITEALICIGEIAEEYAQFLIDAPIRDEEEKVRNRERAAMRRSLKKPNKNR